MFRSTVLKYSIPVAEKLSAISLVVMTAAIGCPFPIGLPVDDYAIIEPLQMQHCISFT